MSEANSNPGRAGGEDGEGCSAYSALTAWAALAFAAILGFSRLSYGLVLPALRADLRGSYGLFGLVGSANLAGYLIGMVAAPPLLARYRDHVRLNTLCLLALGATMVGSAFSLDLAQLGVWRLLIGISSALATVLTIALTLERVAPAQRGRASGVIWMGGAAGLVVSGLAAPLVIGAGHSSAWRIVWIAMGVIGMIAGLGVRHVLRGLRARATTPQPERDEKGGDSAERHRSLFSTLCQLFDPRGLLALTLAYSVAACGYIIYFTFLIALVMHQGVPAPLAGLVWSVLGVGGIVGGFAWGWALDRWPSGFILALALALGAIGSFAVRGLPAELIGAVLMGGTLIGTPAVVTALLRRATPAERYTSSFSVLTALFALGQVIGPLLGGAVVDTWGLEVGVATAGLVLALAALLAAGYGIVQRGPQEKDDPIGTCRVPPSIVAP